jgi:protease I
MKTLENKHVAILVADGFEQVEFTGPKEALEDAGADVTVVSLKSGSIRGFNHDKPGDKFSVDATLDESFPDSFDALMLPGGLLNPLYGWQASCRHLPCALGADRRRRG